MTGTGNALIAALMVIAFAAGCGEQPPFASTGPGRDSLAGHDLALAPLHYVDAAGRLYEVLLLVGADGALAAACYVIDGALFATITPGLAGAPTDVQLYRGGRATFRAMITPAAPPPAADAWPAFAAAADETRGALTAWQRAATGDALSQLHAAVGRLATASAALVTSQ